jgi:hypothetical protein
MVNIMKYKTVSELKKEGMKYWTAQPIKKRLSIAEFPHGDSHGIIYCGQVKIYVDKNGKLYTNKPQKSKMTKRDAKFYRR